MTQDEIIEMARQVEFEAGFKWCVNFIELEAFAKLVAAKEQKKWQDQTAVEIHEAVLEEREACAKVILDSQVGGIGTAVKAAYLIRARGEA